MVAAWAGLSVDGLEAAATDGTPLDKLWSEIAKETLTTQAREGIKGAEARMHRAADLASMATVARMFRTRESAHGPVRVHGDAARTAEVFVAPDLARSYKPMIEQAVRLAFTAQSDPMSPGVALQTAPAGGVNSRGVEQALRQYRDATGRVVLESQASYSSLFPGIEGQRAGSREASLAWILDEDWARVEFGRAPETAGGGRGAGETGRKPTQGGARPEPPGGGPPKPDGAGAVPQRAASRD